MVDVKSGEKVGHHKFENVGANFKTASEVQIQRDGHQLLVEFYEKNGEFFVFDREGNCFRTINNSDLIERKMDTAVDKDSIRAPMPGVVTRVLVKDGDAVKKVCCAFVLLTTLGTNRRSNGGHENGASNQGPV